MLVGLRDFLKAEFVLENNSIFVVEFGRWVVYFLIINDLTGIGGDFDGWMQEEERGKERIDTGVCEVREEV